MNICFFIICFFNEMFATFFKHLMDDSYMAVQKHYVEFSLIFINLIITHIKSGYQIHILLKQP